jgi:hypothetical protein
VNPSVPKGRFALDGVNDITELKGLGADLARDFLPTMQSVFLSEPADEFIPSHAVRQTNERQP